VVEMADPDRSASQDATAVQRVRLPIVMTTGSHHLQAYWVPSIHGNKVRLFPWVYHIDSQRWIPNGDSFILPPEMSDRSPDAREFGQVWNNNCILCHSVAGDVGYDPGNWRSRVAELGISCEACHGPGQAHVDKHRNPANRYWQYWNGGQDDTIVNPRRLSHRKSSEICGQCHVALNDQASTPYNLYRAGGDYQSIFPLPDPHQGGDDRFWSDGTMRVGGREFSGMKESACYLKGELSCLSCHSMHSSHPNKQMREEMKGNQACLQCHHDIGERLSQHTHHAPESSGSLCYNCHMPYTSYALFTAIRSHRIDSPSVQSSVQSGRPVACNQCHLDQTLEWTSQQLEKWYGTPRPELSPQQQSISATVLWLLQGDAVQRTLAGWTCGWEPAREVSGSSWARYLLAQLLDDPYSITRQVAHRSLATFGESVTGYDPLVAPHERSSVAEELQAKWNPPLPERHAGLAPLLDSESRWDRQRIQKLLEGRDNKAVTLNE
jgi:predicted CXXCH cytochrome family protein